MKLYDKPAYRLDEYKELRQLNRTAFMLNPIDYIKLQSDWEDLFTICVKGNVYVLNSFYEGIRYMKSHYRECIPELQSFDSIFTLKHSLPEEIDYMFRRLSGPSHTVVDYMSHKYCFRHVYFDDPDKKEVHTVFYPYFPTDKPVPKKVQEEIMEVINNGYCE